MYVFFNFCLFCTLCTISIIIIVNKPTIIYTVLQRNQALHYLPYLCQTATDFQNSFTDRLERKYATKLSLNFPPHLQVSLHYLVKYFFGKIAPTNARQRVSWNTTTSFIYYLFAIRSKSSSYLETVLIIYLLRAVLQMFWRTLSVTAMLGTSNNRNYVHALLPFYMYKIYDILHTAWNCASIEIVPALA